MTLRNELSINTYYMTMCLASRVSCQTGLVESVAVLIVQKLFYQSTL